MKHICYVFLIQLLFQVGMAFGATVTLPATAGPWDQSLNAAFNYGVHDNDGPVIVDASNGISFSPGVLLSIKYVSGLVSAGDVHPFVDANGDLSYGPTNNDLGNGGFPAHYMGPRTVYLMEMVGTFAKDGVIVGTPFAIGDGPAEFAVPSGTNQLLLGVNDNFFKGGAVETNKGFLVVSVTPAPEPASWTTPLVGLGIIAACARLLQKRDQR